LAAIYQRFCRYGGQARGGGRAGEPFAFQVEDLDLGTSVDPLLERALSDIWYVVRMRRARLLFAAPVLLLPMSAQADRYWDVPEADAAVIAGELPAGSIVVAWCEQCEGDLRVLRVRSAKVAPGTYADDEGRKSVLLDRELLFASASKGILKLAKTAKCGASPKDWVDPGDSDAPSGRAEHLDIPYSFRLESDGTLRWLGARVARQFGQDGDGPTAQASADFIRRLRACASQAEAGKIRPPAPKPSTGD
jgi:hypothetical protein